jgi:hypothetical protein
MIVRRKLLSRKKPLVRKASPMKKESRKRTEALRIYRVLRKDYLLDHPLCECGRKGCRREPAVEIHHPEGRAGELLNQVDNFVAIARRCHNWIRDHQKEAMAIGLIRTRNAVKQVPTFHKEH